MPTPKITNVEMGTTNVAGRVPAPPSGGGSVLAARAQGVEVQAQALAERYMAADGGPNDRDDRTGHVETASDHDANGYRGTRQVGLYDEEIWRKDSVQERSRFRYDPATRTPQEFQGTRNYSSQEYYRDHRGQEPVLKGFSGTHTLGIQWGGNGKVQSLDAVNDRSDGAETLSLRREGGALDYRETSER